MKKLAHKNLKFLLKIKKKPNIYFLYGFKFCDEGLEFRIGGGISKERI